MGAFVVPSLCADAMAKWCNLQHSILDLGERIARNGELGITAGDGGEVEAEVEVGCSKQWKCAACRK